MSEIDFSVLTKREREIVNLMAEGLSNPEIAETLCISISTVRNHMVKIHLRLGTSNRTKIAVRWIRQHEN